jgi:hypothetical protein
MPKKLGPKSAPAQQFPPTEEDSSEYEDGFQAGASGKPCSSSSLEWLRGWADAQE